MFKIDENYGESDYLFTEVRKDKLNERIIAQKELFWILINYVFKRT